MTETIKLFNDELINLRFDLGTARILKDLSGADPIAEGGIRDVNDTGSVIFLAGYKRYNFLFRTLPKFTDEEVKELYFTLDQADALLVISSFNASMSVKKTTAEELIEQTIQSVSKNAPEGESEKKPLA